MYIKVFSSLSELVSALDEDIAEAKKSLGEILRIIEDLRVKAESEKAFNELLAKLGTSVSKKQSNVVNLKNVKIVVNPSANDELQALEALAEHVSRKIMLLQSIRKELEIFTNVNIEARVEVIYVDGVPKEVYVKY